MWTFAQPRRNKQADQRRKKTNGTPPWRQKLRSALGLPLAIAFVFWAAVTYVLTSGYEPFPYAEGRVLKQPVLARVDFERLNQARTDERRREAIASVPNYFRLNQGLIDRIQAELRDIHAAVKATENYEAFQEQFASRWNVGEATYAELKALTDERGSEQFRNDVDRLAGLIPEFHMTERADVNREIRSTASVAILHNAKGKEQSVPKERLHYATNQDDVALFAPRILKGANLRNLRPIIEEVIRQAVNPSPNQYVPVYVYDGELTRAKMDEAAAAVAPVMDQFEEGDRLVQSGRLTTEHTALLRVEHEEYLKQRSHNPSLRDMWRKKQVGVIGITALVTLGLAVFTVYVQPRIARKTPRAVGVASLLLGMLIFDRYILLEIGDSPLWSVVTLTMTAAILTVAYSQLYALGASAALAVLTLIALGAPYGLMIVLLTVISMTVLMLREIRTRMKMVEVGVATSIAAGASTFFVNLADGQVSWSEPAKAMLAAMAGISLVLVLLPVIERFFKVTTSLTLLEWADTSRPLLRQLIEKAPGTWQHSHLLGTMAEAAAEEIGANGLLCRVGAFYHDVGKLCKPHYFVENQQANINAHTGLAPTMSLLVILAHVKDGLALAREHGLPYVLHQFIAEHHGTTVVKYFHAMAAQEAKAGGARAREVSETEFRYPGPRPGSRETAILMLCDGVEGAIRTLADPTPGRIEARVHEILIHRMMDGQFDDCDITLKELARVEQSLVKSLRAIHHGRISYPSAREPLEPAVRTA